MCLCVYATVGFVFMCLYVFVLLCLLGYVNVGTRLGRY